MNTNFIETKRMLEEIENEILNGNFKKIDIDSNIIKNIQILSNDDKSKFIESLYSYAFVKGLRSISFEVSEHLYKIERCSSLLLLIEGAFESGAGTYKADTIMESLAIIRETIDKTVEEIEKIL